MTDKLMWKVGDSCLAPYSGDNELYLAVIEEIKNEGNRHAACVKYLDYSSDDNEIVSLDKLKETSDADDRVITSSSDDGCASTQMVPPSSKFVSPLRYLSEDERLRAKFADLHERPLVDAKKRVITPWNEASSKPSSESSIKQKRRKDLVVIGGNERQKPDNCKQPRLCPAKDTPQKKSLPKSRNLNRTTDDSSSLMQGFTSEELEKPFFPGKSDVGTKLPLVLSEDGCQNVIQVPATINRYLRDYQKDGVKFLYQHFRAKRGCILADDMGLGKTIQVIAFMSAVLKKKGNQEDCQRSLPQFLKKNSGVAVESTDIFLIVCPNSVLFNWLEELDTWTYCAVGKYHGKDRDETIRKALRGRLDVVVTTFETYRTKLESLLEIPWTAIIVDEVHKIKESNSQITAALKEIPTRRRFGLTGTALQNKMAELWCVLDWANPGCLGLWKDFKRKFEMVITKGQKYDASKRELAAGRKAALEFSKLRQSWLLRRTKSLISDQLPTKDEKVVFCQLTDLQISVSKALLASDDMKLVLMQNDPCDCGSQKKKGKCHYKRTSDGLSVKAVTFSFMSALIKAANHTALLIPSPGMSPLQQKTAEKFSKIAFAQHPQFTRLSKHARFCTLSDPHYCGKMMILERLLEMFKKERSKVLLFSYYTKVLLDILETYLRSTDNIYFRLDGKTPASERQRLVRDFNQDPDVFIFLISTKAGGMGLNLTGANVVIIFDPNWNPMYDLQAQDRAYRIGQHRDVRVYRLISTGCIEENMYLRQVYKQQLASVAMTTENAKRYFTAVAGEGQQKGELFGLQNMFSLRTEGSCLTRDLILREVKTEKGITTAKYIPPKLREESEEESFSNANQVSELECDAERSSESTASTDEDEYDSYSDEGDTHGLASQLCESSSDCISPSEDDEGEDSHPGRDNRRNKMNFKKRKKGDDDSDRKIKKEQKTNQSGGGKVAASDKGKSLVRPGGRVVTRVKRSWVTSENSESNVGCKEDSEKTKWMGQRMKDSDSSTSSVGRTESRVRSSRVPFSRSKIVASKKPKRDKEMTKACVMDRDAEDVEDDSCQEDGNKEREVFRECGVAYVHSNLKVIGASKVEDHVSKTALHDVYENEQFSQEPAFCKVPTLEKDSDAESDDVEIKVKKKSKRKDREEREEVSLLRRKKKKRERKPAMVATHRIMGETTLFLGQTPLGIRKEQFKNMAKKLGFASAEKLAETITRSSDETCKEMLTKFYQTVYPSVEVGNMFPASEVEENQDRKNSVEKKTVKGKTLKDQREPSAKSETMLSKIENKSCSTTGRSHPVKGFRCSSGSDCDGNDSSAVLEREGWSEFDQLDQMKKSFVSSVSERSEMGGEKVSLLSSHASKFDSLDSLKLSDLSDLPGIVQKGKKCNSSSNTISSSNCSNLTVDNFSDFNPSKKSSILSSQERNEWSAQPETDLKINLDMTTSESDLSFLDDIFLFPSKEGTRKPPPSNERWKKRVRTLD
ncbi:DNA excision repair protein ERCC-6-like 2 [Holothuria leucospilota]|uniref:DNA excision repair protein ERCC-6-like 2 n=1 Tax=Holothuria leucospilota TaxID=206669 RepID=A0A9Q1C8T0_HOLLE|nr:DNA excision repair protein ERCC-6-like 2 [Holothuria leucospilota]